MSYVVSVVSKPGVSPRTMNSPRLMDDHAAREMCAYLAQSMWRVNLHNVGDDGVISIVAAWERGHRKRKVTTTLPLPVPQVIDGEVEEPIGAELADDMATQLQANGGESAFEGTGMQDEPQTYTAYCVKCKEKRDFPGEIHISDSGRRMARGNCPVCGTRVNTILKNLPHEEQESFDTPDDAPSAVVVAFSDNGEESASAEATAQAGN